MQMRKTLTIGIVIIIFLFTGCLSNTIEPERDFRISSSDTENDSERPSSDTGSDFELSSGVFGINIAEDMELDFDERQTIEIILKELQTHARNQDINDDLQYDDIQIFLWNLVIGGVNGVIEARITDYNERNGFPRKMEILSEDNIWYDLNIKTREVNIRPGEQRIWYSLIYILNTETGESVMYEW